MSIIYLLTLSGDPNPGDLANLCYRSIRGGRTDAPYRTMSGDTATSVAQQIAAVANGGDTGWMKECFEVRQKGGQPIVIIQTSLTDINFDFEVEGHGSLIGKIEKF
jgi:hypothetical protein